LNKSQERLRTLSPAVLKGIRRGIEKESLRVRPEGGLAMTSHPPALGSALTHPHITTDFSESQLELITGVHAGVESCLEELTRIHQVAYRALGDEMMWCASMPCGLPADDVIPIGRYGRSNVGRMKTVYRTGLSHRYGRRMQMISGIHYNFSLPDGIWPIPDIGEPNEAYFALIRNFRRNAWLLFYLFGASPAVCSSFVEGRKHELRELAGSTFHLPYATSLRMGRLGYQSDAQSTLAVSYNNLENYGASLFDALTRSYPPYEAIGIRDGDDYRQLATSLLQIENEFYGKIRAKRVIRPGRAAAARIARARRRVRRGTPDGPRSVLCDRHWRSHDPAARRIPAVLPARGKAPPTPLRKSPPSGATRTGLPRADASPTCGLKGAARKWDCSSGPNSCWPAASRSPRRSMPRTAWPRMAMPSPPPSPHWAIRIPHRPPVC